MLRRYYIGVLAKTEHDDDVHRSYHDRDGDGLSTEAWYAWSRIGHAHARVWSLRILDVVDSFFARTR